MKITGLRIVPPFFVLTAATKNEENGNCKEVF